MTDREMLELAAKAEGLKVDWDPLHECFWIAPGQGISIEPWCPLENDGAALRLAVKLNLTVQFPWDEQCRFARETHCWTENDTPEIEIHGSDPYAATRRAIVRAAAALSTDGSGHDR